MAVNKVVYGSETVMDISSTTAIASDVAVGKYFYDANGVRTAGTKSDSGGEGQTINLQDKTATPTESSQTVVPDSGYDGLSSVTVGAISTVYVGSGVTRRTSSDLTVDGEEVTAPAGYYASSASKSVATATQATPSISVSSTGLITASATQTAGYVSAGTKSATEQLTTQEAATITPTKSSQTAVASGRYTTGTVTVAAIPDEYITTSDATATASEINSGATAYVNGTKVTGTQVIQTYYTGSSAPSSSTGSNGDIYLKVVS